MPARHVVIMRDMEEANGFKRHPKETGQADERSDRILSGVLRMGRIRIPLLPQMRAEDLEERGC